MLTNKHLIKQQDVYQQAPNKTTRCVPTSSRFFDSEPVELGTRIASLLVLSLITKTFHHREILTVGRMGNRTIKGWEQIIADW